MVVVNNEPNYILEMEQISRKFGNETTIQALMEVDLLVESGEWLAITGPSGAGKSTLLNIIGCLDIPSNGYYKFEEIETTTLNDKQRAGLRSQRIGFVFQSFHLLQHRSVLENVMLAEVYRKQSHTGRKERALAAIERVGLAHRANFAPNKLSGGERQRVAIARALIGSPSLLLCDEPTGNLDSKTAQEIFELLATLNKQGLTLIIVTHNEQVAKLAHRRVHIIDGMLADITDDSNSSIRSDNSVPIIAKTTVLQSGIRFYDLIDETLAGIFARPWRTMLTMLGIIIGLTALVATIGLSRTANNRIISQFDELSATEVIVSGRSTLVGVDPFSIPWDAPSRLLRLNGVSAVGNLSEVNIGRLLVSASPVRDPRQQTAFSLAVQAVSPGLFSAVRAELAIGRYPDEGHSIRLDRVAVLGPNAARRLGIDNIGNLPAITIGDYRYLVIGILRDVSRQPALLSSVIIPEGTARHDFGILGPESVIIETQIGAASLIAQQAPLALRPDDTSTLQISFPAEPERVRNAVQADLNVMIQLLGGLSLIVAAIGIANITTVSVIERTSEIGLRRAIGATHWHIGLQFLLESTIIGLIGGILGASIGILIIVVVSATQVWTPVLDASIPVFAPLIGGGIGLLSGTYPAVRAARLEPVEALRN